MRRYFFYAVLLAFAAMFNGPAAQAITHVWKSTVLSFSMANPANWTNGLAPVSGSENLTLQFFASANTYRPNQDISSPLRLQRMEFANANIYEIAGNELLFQNLGAPPSIVRANTASVGDILITAPITFDAPLTIDGGPRSILISKLTGGDASFAGTVMLYNLEPNALTGTYAISGALLLNKPGNTISIGGNLVVAGAGPSPPLQASVTAFGANQLAAGTNISLTNSFFLAKGDQTVNNLTLGNNSAVRIDDGARVMIKGAITYAGGTATLGEGTGVIDFDGQMKAINTSAGNTLNVLSPVVNGGFAKTGPGTLVLTNSGTSLTGPSVVSEGALIAHAGGLGASLQNSGFVDLTEGTLNTTITGSGSVRVGTVTFSAPQSYTGGTTVLSLAAGNATTLVGDFTSTTGGELRFTQAADGAFGGNLSGNVRVTKQGAGVLALGGASTHSGGTTVLAGGLHLLSDSALGSGNLVINNPGVTTLQATGNRTFGNPVQFLGDATFVGSGSLAFTDASDRVQTGNFVHNSSGTTQINGKLTLDAAGSIIVNEGHLVLGDPTKIGGFSAAGPILLNGGTLTVRSLNFTNLTIVTVAGGTLNAPNGYAIPLGSTLVGHGGVTGRLVGASGSSIIADGNLVLGDAAHPAGVNLEGELRVGANAVTLRDANQAVLGPYTTVGTSTADGTLLASNGVHLNFARNLVGRGAVQSNNSAASASIINGDVYGQSATDKLRFTGYVKGVGTFDNVEFSGTFAPGLSPTISHVGTVEFAATSLLRMELGGLVRGSQYDAIDATGDLLLGGTLAASLVEGFTPAVGNQFDLFNGNTLGRFAAFDLPALGDGLFWDTSSLYTTGLLRVASQGPVDADFDGDDAVDGDDLTAWRSGYGVAGAAGNAQGDADGDQDVDGADFLAWQRQVGTSGGGAAAAAPEPGGIIVAAGMALALAVVGRRGGCRRR